jgi:predicted dehydrogenase
MRHIRALKAVGHRAIAVPVRSRALEDIETAATMREAVERGADAAIIATDTGRHIADAEEAIALGCDVLIEKPVAPSADAVGALPDTRAFVAYCLRFHEGLQTFRARLAAVGDVHAVRIVCQSYLPDWRPDRDYRASYSARADEGGVLRDLSHEIDYATWLFGCPARVNATFSATSRLGIQAEEAADLVWTTPSAATVSVRLDYLTRRARRSLLAQGARGEIEWDAVAGTVRVNDEVVAIAHDRDAMMQRQIEAFLSRSSDICTLEEGRRVVALCDAARRSAETGSEENV